MKQANFQHETTYAGRKSTIYGTVTLKDDGKVSVSLHNASHYSSASRYQAKMTANKIVEANFNHPAIYGEITQTNTNLVDRLREQTQELLQLFLQKTKEYSKNHFDWALNIVSLSEEQMKERYGVKQLKPPYYRSAATGLPVTETLSDAGKKANLEAREIVALGLEKLIAKDKKKAEDHYESSLQKLALRLESKYKLNSLGKDVKISTSRIGVNIETIIKWEDNTVKAWTIIAEGEIQRPHYRYLIK